MNRLIQRFNLYHPGCFRLVIGLTSEDPATPEDQKWTTPIELNTGTIPEDVKVLHFLDFVYGHHAVEPTPEWKYWMRYGWVQHPEEPSGHQRLYVEPFVNLILQYSEDDVKGFMMQCMVRRQKVYPTAVDTFGHRHMVKSEPHVHTLDDIEQHWNNPHYVRPEDVGLDARIFKTNKAEPGPAPDGTHRESGYPHPIKDVKGERLD